MSAEAWIKAKAEVVRKAIFPHLGMGMAAEIENFKPHHDKVRVDLTPGGQFIDRGRARWRLISQMSPEDTFIIRVEARHYENVPLGRTSKGCNGLEALETALPLFIQSGLFDFKRATIIPTGAFVTKT